MSKFNLPSVNNVEFEKADYSDSDYIYLARNYRNQEGAVIVLKVFNSVFSSIKSILDFSVPSIFRKA